MPNVKVDAFSISLDGFGAGPRQDLQNPLGVRGLELRMVLQDRGVPEDAGAGRTATLATASTPTWPLKHSKTSVPGY
jgi:hypothetical protein